MTDPVSPPAVVPWRLGALTAFAPMSIDMYLSSQPSIGRTQYAGADQTQAIFFLPCQVGRSVKPEKT